MMNKLPLLLSAVLFAAGINTAFAALSGTGAELDPYLIESISDFNQWRSNTTYHAAGKFTRLMTDLDLGGTVYSGLQVVGNSSTFAGDFNGNGYKILNFSMTNGAGMFFYLSGSIRNLSVINCSIISTSTVAGGLCKQIQASGTVSNCFFSGSVSSTNHYVGGIAGWNDGSISSCCVQADVAGGSLYACTGVFVGGNYGQIADCYAGGSAAGEGWLGGFVGYLDATATIDNCYSTAGLNIIGSAGGQIDGFVGRRQGTIQNCFLDETTSATTSSNTGVIGLTAAAMQVESNFTAAGWDFANTWTMPASGAAVLKWQAEGTFCARPLFFDYNNDCLITMTDFAAFAATWLDCGYANQLLCP